MAEMVLMEKGAEQMNVPANKVQKFLENGWVEISRTSVTGEPAAKVEAKATEAEESAKTDEQVQVEKPKRASSRKAKA